jgi:hypothetical protein
MWSRIRSSRWRSLGVSVLLVLPVALIISAQMVDHINSMEGIEAFFSMIMFASSVTIAVCLLCRTIYRGFIGKNVLLRSALLTACAAFHTAQGLAIAVMTVINPSEALGSWIFCATPWIAGLLLTSAVLWFDGRQRGSGTRTPALN